MSAYICHRSPDAAHFLDRAESWLVRNEAENNLILAIAAQLAMNPRAAGHAADAYLATVEHDGEIVGAAFRTPPFKLGVTRMPLGAARVLAQDAMQVFDDIPSVLGPEAVASAVAGEIASARGKAAEPGMRQRIYELHKVIPPQNPPPGKLRLARPSDEELFAQWLSEFEAETNHGPGDVRAYTQMHIANKTLFFWDDDGPRTSALWAGMTPHGVRIGFVYTPPDWRGHGYGSACTAAASQRALDSGYDFCCLYTDLGNPTSNSIYQKIGYTPVSDAVDYNIVESA
jgi:predicted GNAT family acetyltransferase